MFAKPSIFAQAIPTLGRQPLIACHNDADGLSAGAILIATLRRVGLDPDVRIVGRGENAYSQAFAAEIRRRRPDSLIIADLGVARDLPAPDVPTIVIDHHVPSGAPDGATVISGVEDDPIPTTSLLAYRCAQAAGVAEGLLWLAALGIIGDMAENDGFPEMAEARKTYGVTALRQATSLINAPRRSATVDAKTALDLLLKAQGPKDVLAGDRPEARALVAAKEEVQRELAAARRVGPKIVGEVAIILFRSPCQVHPLIAQQWRGRLKDRIVIAANAGYVPGRVHFAARTAMDVDLIAFFAERRPPHADEQYGHGHRSASGGALVYEDWNVFVRSLGFGREVEIVAAEAA